MNLDERAELDALAAAERMGHLLTGAQRGRLADLRKAEILSLVALMLPPAPVGGPTAEPVE